MRTATRAGIGSDDVSREVVTTDNLNAMFDKILLVQPRAKKLLVVAADGCGMRNGRMRWAAPILKSQSPGRVEKRWLK